MPAPEGRTSVNGDQAQCLAQSMLLDHGAHGQPGSWISRALLLCLAPHYFPLLRPVLTARAVDPRPYDVLY
eukprot:1627834-Pyramimonas_sp.AAC.1